MIAKAGEKGRNNMVYIHGESCGNRNIQKLVLPEKVRLSSNSSTTYLHYLAFQFHICLHIGHQIRVSY